MSDHKNSPYCSRVWSLFAISLLVSHFAPAFAEPAVPRELWGSAELSAWEQACVAETWPRRAICFEGTVPKAYAEQLAACEVAFRVARSIALLQEGKVAQAMALADHCARELALPDWLSALIEGPNVAAGDIPPLPWLGDDPALADYRSARLNRPTGGTADAGSVPDSLTAAQFRSWLETPPEESGVPPLSSLAAIACEMLRAGVADVSMTRARADAWRAYCRDAAPAVEVLRHRALAALARAATEVERTDLLLSVGLPGGLATEVKQARLEPFGGHQTIALAVDGEETGRLSLRLLLADADKLLGPVRGGMLRVTRGDRSRWAEPLCVGDRLAAAAEAVPEQTGDGRLCIRCDLGPVAPQTSAVRVRVKGPSRGSLATLTVEGADAPLVRESLYHDFRTMETEIGEEGITVELPMDLSLVRVAADVRVWPTWREELHRREMELRETLAELSGAGNSGNQSVRNAASGIMMRVKRAAPKGATEELYLDVERVATGLKAGEPACGSRRDELLGGLRPWVDRVTALEMIRTESEAAAGLRVRLPEQVRVVSWLPLEAEPSPQGSREVCIGLHVPAAPTLPPTDPDATVTLQQAAAALDALLQDARHGQVAPAEYHAAARAWAMAATQPEDWDNRTMVSSWLLENHSRRPLAELAQREVTATYERLKQDNEAWLKEVKELPAELAATLPAPVSQVLTTRGELGSDMPMPPGAAVVHQIFAGGLWRMTDPALDMRPRYLFTHLGSYASFYSERLEALSALRLRLEEDHLPRVRRLLAARLTHNREVERLRALAELVGRGAGFDRDLIVPEGDPAVRYLLLAQTYSAGAVRAVAAWEEMTRRRGEWIASVAERCVAGGERLARKERLLRAELHLRRTQQAAELLGFVENAGALQAALEPLVQTTQAVLPGAPSETALPLDLAGARWETVAAGLGAWQATLSRQLATAAQDPQMRGGALAAGSGGLPEILAALEEACGATAAGCDEAARQEVEIAATVKEYHELEREARLNPVPLYAAVEGAESLAALVDRNGRPSREGETEIRRVVDEQLLPRSWQTEFDATWQPQVERLRATGETFRRHRSLFSRAARVYEKYAPTVAMGRARWSEKILPLADNCRAAETAQAQQAALAELYAAFDSRLGYSNEQRAAVLGDRVELPEVDAELLPAVAAAAAAYCETAASQLMASAGKLRETAATIEALTPEQAATHSWRQRAQLELDLADGQVQLGRQPGARCMAWLQTTLVRAGLSTAAETLAAAIQAHAQAAGDLETAYQARLATPLPETVVASEPVAGPGEG